VICDLKPYPAYKRSGVPWLDQVPEHWEVRRLGQIGSLSKGNGGSKEDEAATGVPCVRYGDLYTTHTYFIAKSRSVVSPERAKGYTPISFGDVLFAASGETIDEIGKSAVNLIQTEACCGGDVILFRPKREVCWPPARRSG
jgi:type I restriction enzyme S subunit